MKIKMNQALKLHQVKKILKNFNLMIYRIVDNNYIYD